MKNDITTLTQPSTHKTGLDHDPLWYKNAIIYELHIRAFYDSNGDGIGDFRGLTERLEYIKDLGITALWLLPFFPSPLKDDGYDISDYKSINPIYGSLKDFKAFLHKAHKLGIRVIIELVVNHTSDEHAWFQRSRKAKPGSPERNMYVWSDTDEKYKDTRIIFQDFEMSNWTWDREAQAYYWHRFYSHQPDLNFENPRVHRELLGVLKFWMDLGVDGIRLDAVPYLYEKEGTNCENLPETHTFLRKLRKYIDKHYENRMLLAEANQWPEDAAEYFGKGDECHMCFHFPLMPRMFMAVKMEDRFPILDILDQTPQIHDSCQWATFLRNHDELTLEMVTDEERDYMYRYYAQEERAKINVGIRRRLAPLLQNNRTTIELINSILFSMPGTPVLYYGDEIGMGDNIYLGDRDGVRTPLQWSPDRNAGFSKANPQQLYLPVGADSEYHYEYVNIETQQRNSNSLLWWMKQIISIRKEHPALQQGSLSFLNPDNRKVLAFLREYQDEIILVVANLSQHIQYLELDLAEMRDYTPIELFGNTAFPPIGELPYFLTLGPHGFYWFSLTKPEENIIDFHQEQTSYPSLSLPAKKDALFQGKTLNQFEKILKGYITNMRWFSGKSKGLKKVSITERVPINTNQGNSDVLFLEAHYSGAASDTFLLPVCIEYYPEADEVERAYPGSIILQFEQEKTSRKGILYEALANPVFTAALLDGMLKKKNYRGKQGAIENYLNPGVKKDVIRLINDKEQPLVPEFLLVEQSNSAINYQSHFLLKVLRKIEAGINPDLELGKFLTEKQNRNPDLKIAPFAGSLEYVSSKGQRSTLGILQRFMPNQGDAWQYTLDVLHQFFQSALSSETPVDQLTEDNINELLGYYTLHVELLAQRTADLHLLLHANTTNKDFKPENFTQHYQRSLYQSLRTRLLNTFDALKKSTPRLPKHLKLEVEALLKEKQSFLKQFSFITQSKIKALRGRIHGDYHLGQVLFTGNDFIIVDFEGEPGISIGERKIKRSPLKDIAGMLRSFEYAGAIALHGGTIRQEDIESLLPWMKTWCDTVASVFLKTYYTAVKGGGFLPDKESDRDNLLNFYLLEKTLYELTYELDNRPDWVFVPLQGLLKLKDLS
ncbi:MAG: maltose alpha-D-glucosyltransferase [Fibrobacteria bacterium]|nr:maltose alpha-D-glucosyltransferase [Fibrobacteria bacterium]